MRLLAAFALVIAMAACGSPTPTQSPTKPSPTAYSSVLVTTTLTAETPHPTEASASSPTPLPSAVAALLANPENNLYLAPLPAGHTDAVDRDVAIAAMLRDWNVTGPVLYLGHGLHGGQSVWLVIAKVQDMAPIPVGPGCPSPPCHQTWAVNDYLVQLVSDQTGMVAPGGFTTMREVPAPT